MNELTMENSYMKCPYHGSEIGFVFQELNNGYSYVSSKGEQLVKGNMILLDPDKKLRPVLEAISPTKGRQFNWTKMGLLVCMRKDKLNDPYYIIHNFISKMKEL